MGAGNDMGAGNEMDVRNDLLTEMDQETASAFEPGSRRRSDAPLLAPQDVSKYRSRWDVVQSGFIDDPRRAVEQADSLVDTVLKRLTDSISYERDQLVQRWDRNGEPSSTEDLRISLQGYRAFLDRVLML